MPSSASPAVSRGQREGDHPTIRCRQGVACALKLRGFELAGDRGYNCLRTWSNTFNAPMPALNEKLGSEKKAADNVFKKDL
jgi:hypothetical protein